jgi:hypothetical protein
VNNGAYFSKLVLDTRLLHYGIGEFPRFDNPVHGDFMAVVGV